MVVPGSGFGQRDGTFHFRTTFLPSEEDIGRWVAQLLMFSAVRLCGCVIALEGGRPGFCAQCSAAVLWCCLYHGTHGVWAVPIPVLCM